MITAHDLQTLNQATLALYSAELTLANYPDAAFQFLHALVGTDQVNYANLDPVAGTMDMASSAPTVDWAKGVEGFGRHMSKYPFSNFDPTVNDGKPFLSTDFMSLRQFRDLDLYDECFRVLGMDHHGAVHVPTDDGRVLWFGLERAGARGYEERDRLMLTLAQPHLANARRLACARQKALTELKLDLGSFTPLGFTARESETAYWLTAGKTNVEIGLLVGLHVQTVKCHVTSLFNKTGTGNRLALTLRLLELAGGLVAPGTPMHTVRARRGPRFNRGTSRRVRA
jgi:DNA-binding CsgD family transcriptional regulator